jgi:hypothetical protein
VFANQPVRARLATNSAARANRPPIFAILRGLAELLGPGDGRLRKTRNDRVNEQIKNRALFHDDPITRSMSTARPLLGDYWRWTVMHLLSRSVQFAPPDSIMIWL